MQRQVRPSGASIQGRFEDVLCRRLWSTATLPPLGWVDRARAQPTVVPAGAGPKLGHAADKREDEERIVGESHAGASWPHGMQWGATICIC